MVRHAYNLSTWEAEEELLQVTGQHGLPCEFQGSLGYDNRTIKTKENPSLFHALESLPNKLIHNTV